MLVTLQNLDLDIEVIKNKRFSFYIKWNDTKMFDRKND